MSRDLDKVPAVIWVAAFLVVLVMGETGKKRMDSKQGNGKGEGR